MPKAEVSKTAVEFWVDPICPWCWVTANWIVREVAPRRELDVTWQPISLLFKNNPDPESPYYASSAASHRMLRVMEAIRATHGDQAVFNWYWQCGTRIHHDQDKSFVLADALAHIGLERELALAADDESWDVELRRRMDLGLELVGNEVGTPIIAFTCTDGTKRGIFGPVLTRVPPTETALEVWDAMAALTRLDGFWELKRTRTERPDLGPRPEV
jgi:predicted DsbA family dithiol-disulfide isomerase